MTNEFCICLKENGETFGTSFMELDLHGKVNTSKYDAKCLRDTHLMVLNKKSFDRVCARMKKKQMNLD